MIITGAAEWISQAAETCAPDRCRNGVACYAPACYGVPGYGRADQGS